MFELSKKLQKYFDSKYKTGVVTVGYSDDLIYVYKHSKNINHNLPDFVDPDKVRFVFVGKIKPA